MKIPFKPVEFYLENTEEYLLNNKITFEELKKFNPNEFKFEEYWEFVIMDYLTQKKMTLESQIFDLQGRINQFNEAVEIAKKWNINQNLVGEPLTKFKIQVNREYFQ